MSNSITILNYQLTSPLLKITGLTLLCLSFAFTAFAQPINDNPSNAIHLTVTPTFSFEWYATFLATDSNVQPQPDCGNYSGGDVWFKVTVPSTGNLRIDVKANENPKFVMALYRGTIGNLDLHICSTTGANGQINSRIDLADDMFADEVVYLRVFRFGTTAGADFRISAYNNESTIENSCPETAILLSNDGRNFIMGAYSSESATTTSSVPPPTCGAYNGNDVWFKTEVPMNGKMVIETNPGTITPVVTAYTGTIGNLVEYDCSLSGLTDNGGEIIIDDPMLAGEELHIRVFGHNQVGGGTFDIVALPLQDDICMNAVELTDIAVTETYTRYTNQYAEMATNGTQATCGSFVGKDIWFTVTVPSNGKLTLDTKKEDTSPVMPVLTVYTGPDCSNLTQYDCNFFGSTNPFGAVINIDDPALKGQTIFIRMYGYADATGGAFEMAVTQPDPGTLPVELLSFRGDVLNNEAVLLKWQTAMELNNDYFIIEHSIDAVNYTPVGHITGVGTADELQSYRFEHNEPYFGENYYRLKQVNFDGAFEYSNIVTAIIKMEEAKVNVYPNPVVASQGMNVRWIGDFGRETTQLAITNSAGRQVFFQEMDVQYERQTFIDMSRLGLTAGIYYLTVRDKNALITHQKLNLVRD